MKNKIRQITINNKVFFYRITNNYIPDNQTNILKIKVFLKAKKNTPFQIHFHTIDDKIIGQPLNSGIELLNQKTQQMHTVNINKPMYIRQLILLAQNKGWNGSNCLEIQDGLQYLENLGYNIDCLRF